MLKFFACSKAEVNEEERTVVAYVTTEALDRDKEIVLAAGADLTNYRKNPVVLWGHDSRSPPVAKNIWIRQDGHGLLAKTQYAKTDRAEEIWQLRKEGFLKGYSIGFQPKTGKTIEGLAAYGPPHEKELRANPEWKEARNIVRAWEMVEYSDVPVPCNPEALARAYHGKSLNISPATAKELEIPDPGPVVEVVTTKVYSFSAWELQKAVKKARSELKEQLLEQLKTELPEIIKEQLHVARGGV